MASTYTPAGIELIADGEQSATWGDTTNTNWELMEEMVGGVVSIALSSTTYTLTTSDGVSSNGRHAVIVFTGAPGGTCTVTVSPNDMQKVYFVLNNSNQTVTLSQGSGSSVSVAASKAKIVYCNGAGSSAAVVDISTSTTLADLGVTATAAELNILDGVTATAAELNILDGVTATTAELNILDGVTATTAELNILDGVTATAAEINILDGVTATAAEINILDGVTATTTELNYVDGVTSNVQTQLNAKASLSGATFTGDIYATRLGFDTTDYIDFSNNAYIQFIVNGAEDWRMVAGGAFHADGDVIAYSATISDERLKTDIRTVENALDMVNQMRGVTFTYKKDGKQSAGVVAQELEKVFPRAVHETELPLKAEDNALYKVVQYDQLHAILIEAVKELSARVAELEAR